MTLQQWISRWWGWPTRIADNPITVVPARRTNPRVPAEYVSLHTYLDHRYATTVVLTFEQVEALLGFALPGPARVDRGWWTGAVASIDRHADAWEAAGRDATPNLLARTVAFERLRDRGST